MRQPCAVVVSARALCNILNEQEIKPHKSVLYACGTLGSFQTFSKLSSLGAFTDSTQPADTYNASDDPCEMYFVTSRNFNFGGGQCVNGCNGLIVWGLYGTIGSQTMSGVTVAMPVQPGSVLVSVSFGASSGSILEPRRYWTRPGADIRA